MDLGSKPTRPRRQRPRGDDGKVVTTRGRGQSRPSVAIGQLQQRQWMVEERKTQTVGQWSSCHCRAVMIGCNHTRAMWAILMKATSVTTDGPAVELKLEHIAMLASRVQYQSTSTYGHRDTRLPRHERGCLTMISKGCVNGQEGGRKNARKARLRREADRDRLRVIVQ